MSDDDLFECATHVGQAYPDDIALWPGSTRTAVYEARDSLLEKSPGRRVIEERSYCIGRDHPRFPDNVPLGLTHVLVYEVRLSPELRAVG